MVAAVLLVTIHTPLTPNVAFESGLASAADSTPTLPNESRANDVRFVERLTEALDDPSPGVELAGMISLEPTRLLDTRTGLGVAQPGKISTGSTISLRVLGRGGVPTSGVDSVVLNVTVTEPTASSYVTVWPTGKPRPNTSSLNMTPGETNPNLVITRVGTNGSVDLFNAFGKTHVIADVVAWSGTNGHLRSLDPERVLDTRTAVGVPGTSPVGPASAIDVQVSGRGGVPDQGVGAVVLNVTVTEPTAPSYVTVWPTGKPRPTASSLNMLPGETNPNLVISRVGDDGLVSLYNAFGTAHLIADVVGWIPTGGAYVPINPKRILDTRDGTGEYGTMTYFADFTTWFLRPRQIEFRTWLNADDTVQLEVSDTLGVPAGATSVVLNITATAASEQTYVTSWAWGDDRPTTSTLNLGPGETVPNLAIVEVGDRGYINLFNKFGHVDLVVDAVGYFVARNTDDQPDQIKGAQIHVVHMIPSDVVSPSFDDDDIIHTLDVAETWLEQHGDRGLRFDLSGGQIEITDHHISLTTAQIATLANQPYDVELLYRLMADGFAAPGKIYLVFADRVDTGGLCGLQTGSADTALIAIVFTGSCSPLGGYRPNSTGDWTRLGAARTTVHELLHAMGASSPCGPDYSFGNHVSDERDIMYPTDVTDGTGIVVAGGASVLDAGNDDYWGRAYADCFGSPQPDVALSPFLDALR